VDAVTERLENGEQAMLMLNRRGFSSFVACRACGDRLECANCSVTLTFHAADRRMLCHYCNYAETVPSRCKKCDSDQIQFLGVGSERVEQELHHAFPKARVARLDRDTVGAKRDYETILTGFRDHHFDILVGTQMIAKGHDIPNVTLVGIVNADIGLAMPDFRAAERAFQIAHTSRGPRRSREASLESSSCRPASPTTTPSNAQPPRTTKSSTRKNRIPPHDELPSVSEPCERIIRSSKEEDAISKSAALGRLMSPAPEASKCWDPRLLPSPA